MIAQYNLAELRFVNIFYSLLDCCKLRSCYTEGMYTVVQFGSLLSILFGIVSSCLNVINGLCQLRDSAGLTGSSLVFLFNGV